MLAVADELAGLIDLALLEIPVPAGGLRSITILSCEGWFLGSDIRESPQLASSS